MVLLRFVESAPVVGQGIQDLLLRRGELAPGLAYLGALGQRLGGTAVLGAMRIQPTTRTPVAARPTSNASAST